VRRAGFYRINQDVTLNIRCKQHDHFRRILCCAHTLRLRHGRIVDGRHRDRNRGRCGVQQAVVGLEGEAVRPVVIGCGRVGDGVRGDHAQRSM